MKCVKCLQESTETLNFYIDGYFYYNTFYEVHFKKQKENYNSRIQLSLALMLKFIFKLNKNNTCRVYTT